MRTTVDTIAEQVRAAQGRASSPVEAANLRDALTLRVVEATAGGLIGSPLTPTGYAATVFQVVDALMAERETRAAATLAEIEVWGAQRAQVEGIALASGSEVVAAALLRRYGGDIEIPMAELDDVFDATERIAVQVDEARQVVRYNLQPKGAKS